MTVRLRLQRRGARKRPFYRVVATDKRNPRDGRFIEILGTYNPLFDPPELRLNSERIDYWLGVGAQPSDTVRSLIRRLKSDDSVIDLSEEGAEAKAKAEKAAARKQAREEARKQAAEAAKAAEEAKKAEEEAKKAEAEAAKKAEEEAKKAEAAAEEAGDADEGAEEAGEEAADEKSDKE